MQEALMHRKGYQSALLLWNKLPSEVRRPLSLLVFLKKEKAVLFVRTFQ